MTESQEQAVALARQMYTGEELRLIIEQITGEKYVEETETTDT